MFLRHLNWDQKKSMLVMAFNMMIADKVIRDEEKELMEALKHELGVATMTRAEYEAGPNLFLFTDRRTKLAAMLKLASIAYADTEYHRDEIRLLVQYGREFGLTTDEMRAIDSWGRRHQQLVADAEALMNAPDPVVDADEQSKEAEPDDKEA